MAKCQGFRHILVLVDGTSSSFHAVDCVIELAAAVGSKLTAIAIVDTEVLLQLLNVRILVDTEMGELEQQLTDNSRHHLDDVLERGRRKGLEIEDVLTAGNTEIIIPKEIKKRGIDIAVIGSYQSTDVRHDLLARQRQEIMDHAPCAVLMVK